MAEFSEYQFGQIVEAIERGISNGLGEQPTLRDGFAMAALQGLLAGGMGHDAAKGAYRIADTMLEARTRKSEAT